MDGDGVLIFDVNDFDEAYVGHFTWDVTRFAASLALLGWRKALSDDDITDLVRSATRGPTSTRSAGSSTRPTTAASRCGWAPPTAPSHQVLQLAKLRTRVELLDGITETEGFDRVLRDGPGLRRLDDAERAAVLDAFERYLDSIPEAKRLRGVTYTVKDVAGRSGFGIGSAGLPAYTLLIEGYNQALDNDVVLSMKQGNVAAPSRVVTDPEIAGHFQPPRAPHGDRRSGRCRRTPTRCWAGPTSTASGFVVSEVSPYEADLDWSELTEPAEIAPVVAYLGPGHRQGALRGRRRRRPLAGPVPDRGRDLRGRRRARGRVRGRGWWTSRTPTPPRCAPTTRCSSRRSGPARSPAWPSAEES